MKVEYDAEHDIMNIEFLSKQPISESLDVDGVVIDYSADGRIVSIEIIDASKRTDKDPLSRMDFSVIQEKAVL